MFSLLQIRKSMKAIWEILYSKHKIHFSKGRKLGIVRNIFYIHSPNEFALKNEN